MKKEMLSLTWSNTENRAEKCKCWKDNVYFRKCSTEHWLDVCYADFEQNVKRGVSILSLLDFKNIINGVVEL